MTFTDQSETRGISRQEVQNLVDRASPWDQFNQNLLLTVQALQRLHTAFDERFTRSPGG